jgi:hypothetical protein
VLADTLARDLSPSKAPNLANYNKLPDYQFLVLVGTSGQPRITKKEFDAWARNYANTLADQEEAQRRIKESQAKFVKAKTAAAKQKAMAELQQHQQEFAVATAALNAIPAAVRQKLAVKR